MEKKTKTIDELLQELDAIKIQCVSSEKKLSNNKCNQIVQGKHGERRCLIKKIMSIGDQDYCIVHAPRDLIPEEVKQQQRELSRRSYYKRKEAAQNGDKNAKEIMEKQRIVARVYYYKKKAAELGGASALEPSDSSH